MLKPTCRRSSRPLVHEIDFGRIFHGSSPKIHLKDFHDCLPSKSKASVELIEPVRRATAGHSMSCPPIGAGLLGQSRSSSPVAKDTGLLWPSAASSAGSHCSGRLSILRCLSANASNERLPRICALPPWGATIELVMSNGFGSVCPRPLEAPFGEGAFAFLGIAQKYDLQGLATVVPPD